MHKGNKLSQVQRNLLIAIVILTAWNALRYTLNLRFIANLEKTTQHSFELDADGMPREVPVPDLRRDYLMTFETDPPSKYYPPADTVNWIGIDPEVGLVRLAAPAGYKGAARNESGGVEVVSGADESRQEIPFVVSMYHVLHCIYFIRSDLEDSRRGVKLTKMAVEHAHHCYNYVREALMCAGDVTLEPRIVEQLSCENYNAQPKPFMLKEGHPHVCRDWRKVRDYVGDNFRRHHNATGPFVPPLS